MITVGRFLDHEAKVDRDTLIALGCMARVLGTVSNMPQFSTSTDRAGVKFGGNGHLGNTTSVLVEIRDMLRMEVTKTLMPQEA
jgi:hypothetical protein